MENVKVENLAKNRVKFTITVPADDVRPYLEAAASRISEKSNIPGFRPGKASYDVVKERVGEMKIMEEALEEIVRKHLVKAVLENQIETVGSPAIDVEKMVPGNDLVFTAEVTRMPKVDKLADFRKLSIKAKPVVVEDKDIELALKDIRRMQTREVRAKTGDTVGAGDKVVVSMDMKKDGVAVDGGSSPNHAIFLAEDYYIPGFKDQIIGLKEGDKKSFTLPFPKDHVQKMLAGSDVLFEVGIKEIFHLETPPVDDAFAQSLGQKDVATLRATIKDGITKEKQMESRTDEEREMLELVAEKTRFEDIPDLLLNEEIMKMVQELEHRVEEQGMVFDKYLESIKKTLAQLKMDFTPQAILRIKVALLLREIAKQEKIEADQKRVDEELDKLASRYEDAETKKQIYAPQYRVYMESVDRNRQIIDKLRAAMIK